MEKQESQTHSRSLHLQYLPSAYYIFIHEISPLSIPKQRPFCEPNPEMGSRDYKFLNPGSQMFFFYYLWSPISIIHIFCNTNHLQYKFCILQLSLTVLVSWGLPTVAFLESYLSSLTTPSTTSNIYLLIVLRLGCLHDPLPVQMSNYNQTANNNEHISVWHQWYKATKYNKLNA